MMKGGMKHKINMANKNDTLNVLPLIVFGLIFIFVLILFFGSFYTVSAGYRGVELFLGKPNPIASAEGFHLKVPFLEKVKKIEVRTQKMEITAASASKDLQNVQTTIALNYHVIPEEVSELYTKIGLAYRERIIEPSVQEAVKSVTARFTAEELITKREEVKNQIKETLKDKLRKSYLVVDDFNIVNFQFSEQFDLAIEAKQIAEQEALRAERELEKVKIEAQQKVVQAEAEAESLRLQAEQIKESKDILELRAIEKWDGKLPVYTGSGAVPFIDITPITPTV